MEINQDKKDGLNRICDECIVQRKTTPESFKQLMDYVTLNNMPGVANPLQNLYNRYYNKLNIHDIKLEDFIHDFRKIVFD